VEKNRFTVWILFSLRLRNYSILFSCVDRDKNIVLTSVDENIAEDYLSYVCLVKDKEGEIVIPAKYHSESHVGGVKSAIKSLYKSDKVAVPEEDAVNLKKEWEK